MRTVETPAIRVEGLRKTFEDGTTTVTAVDDITFQIEKGTVVGLLGPNGAGKTTTIKSMLGLVVPDAGTVEICGVDVHDQPDQAYKKIGAILEGARNVYWRLTVRENLSFFAGLGGDDPTAVRDRHDELLEQFGLVDRADTPVKDLSRGMKQKVSLASTLARDVEVVFMDEPTLGLDIETSLELRTELCRLTDREDVTIVLCSHDMDVIESVCDSVLVLNEGSIVEYDEVDALLQVFRTRQYQITVESTLSTDARERLEQVVDVDYSDEDKQFTITFTATDGNEIYEVMNILQRTGQNILDIESLKPDLEDIFLQITDTSIEDSGRNGADETLETGGSSSVPENAASASVSTEVSTGDDR
ncbi:ABC transporter ATP-binding protein [Halopiger djelfimassiliensis]|uniref:ABC transporter ATP-binding protein n=1 Tax=Halopiger djelfimassiliensis TaxID=1293047 RepID=UPI0006779C36|nr:ABC transporter ATP-binding protein [Halopiger djelfimassiliensis]